MYIIDGNICLGNVSHVAVQLIKCVWMMLSWLSWLYLNNLFLLVLFWGSNFLNMRQIITNANLIIVDYHDYICDQNNYVRNGLLL